MKWQERATALAEGRPLPALSSSGDIRSLNMEDFRDAHERVYDIEKISNFYIYTWLPRLLA